MTLSTREGVRPCGGTLAFLDRYVSGIGSVWTGEQWRSPEPLFLELRAQPSGTVGGRATHLNRAWAGQQACVLHELVHLVTGTIDGWSAASLGEGTAEAFGSSRMLEIWGPFFYPPHPTEFAFLSPDAFNGGYDPAAGQTTAALTRRFGRGGATGVSTRAATRRGG